MYLVNTQLGHLDTLKSWFTDLSATRQWGGPGIQYPFDDTVFLKDIQWQKMPSYSFVDKQQRLLGFGQYYNKYGRCHLARLAIAPQQRGQGLGQRFISALINAGLADLKVKHSSLYVLNDNLQAIRCYRALGFEPAQPPPEEPHFEGISFMIKPCS